MARTRMLAGAGILTAITVLLQIIPTLPALHVRSKSFRKFCGETSGAQAGLKTVEKFYAN